MHEMNLEPFIVTSCSKGPLMVTYDSLIGSQHTLHQKGDDSHYVTQDRTDDDPLKRVFHLALPSETPDEEYREEEQHEVEL